MSDFIMTTQPKLSGAQKAAILLAELGQYGQNHDAADAVLACLDLSTEEKTRIRLSMENLGYYNPHDKRQAERENQVLQEVIDYGQKMGIFVPFHVTPSNPLAAKTDSVAEMVKSNPDAIAKILGTWLEG